MSGALLTKWTIRLALTCYVTCLAGWLSFGPARLPRPARLLWTLGCVLFDVHVACAFHFYHHWSHAVAWQHTAERTHELLGVAVGNGIYFSYLFLLLWLLDVVWLWGWPSPAGCDPNASPTSGSPDTLKSGDAIAVPPPQAQLLGTPWWRVAVHAFLLFVAVNGAIVFESGITRWAGLGAGFFLTYLVVRQGYNDRRAQRVLGPSTAVDPAAASLHTQVSS